MRLLLLPSLALGLITPLYAQSSRLDTEVDRRAAQVQGKVVAWRRDIHAHPELSNRETRTADLVAQHLRSLGIEVRTGVAHTGVVGVLRGGKPGPVVALRADMDALPVTEEVDVPFASKVRATYNGQDVGVMHACGHDTHVAMLMGVAEVLAGMRNDLPGTVKFIFQPAEEGAPAGERGGAALMIEEGALDDPKPSAIFGLHVFPYPAGEIRYRSGGIMASADAFRIVVRGRQTHGALPWAGIDPIVVASQIVLGLQTITSRQVDVTAAPAIVTVGAINGGVRFNIIPDSVVMLGTIRTYNDPALTEKILPTLREVAGASHVAVATPTTTAEDFSRYQQRIPGVFFFLGITPPGTDPAKAAPNHSPRFYVDEAALPVGVRALAHLAVDYLAAQR
jgi:amidohydrolase